MKQLKHWVEEHKKMSAVCLCLLLMFIGGSAMSALRVASNRATQAQEQSVAKKDASTANDADITLTSEQKTLIADYDEKTEDFIATLCASVWSAGDGRYLLKFSETSYTETVNGESTEHGYAISRLDADTDQQGQPRYTIAFLTDTGTHIVTYASERAKDAKDTTAALSASLTSSSMFEKKNTAYESSEAVEDITVKGMNSEVVSLFGNDESALVSALSNWCALNYPTATEVTWGKLVDIDYEKGTNTTYFEVKDTTSNASAITLSCVYTRDTGKFTFSM